MRVYEKAFETLEVIKQETEKCYQELKKECKTYKELEKQYGILNGMENMVVIFL